MLTCYFHRRRIGAWLDGALDLAAARTTQAHVARCARCAEEAEALQRLSAMLRAAPPVGDPDWTGFWPGIVRRIDDARHAPARPQRRGWLTPRLAYGGAVAAALLISLTVWQLVPTPPAPESPVIVRSADTGYPGGHVMVYTTPEQDLTVVWVFGVE